MVVQMVRAASSLSSSSSEGTGSMQKYDGTYLINDHMETLEVVQENDVFVIEYKTEFATWKEKILHVCSEELALENENQTIYYYKRQPSFDLNESK
jgi:hypothetical protein